MGLQLLEMCQRLHFARHRNVEMHQACKPGCDGSFMLRYGAARVSVLNCKESNVGPDLKSNIRNLRHFVSVSRVLKDSVWKWTLLSPN